MKMKSSPSQFELAALAMMAGGTHAPKGRVKLAMDVWEEAGKTLFPESQPRVAVTLEQLLKRLFPEIGNGKKKQSVKELNAARMAKYRKFLEWCEWAKWGPDYVRSIPNEQDGGQKEIPVIKSFVQKNVKATIKIQEMKGIFDAQLIEEEFCYYCAGEKVRREVVLGERARKGAAASHAKKVAAKSPAAAKNPKRNVSPRKTVK